MRPYRGLAGIAVLLLGAAGCGTGGTSSSTATSRQQVTSAKVAFEACPGSRPGLLAIEPSGAMRWSRCDESGSHNVITVAIADGLAYIVEQGHGEPTLVALDVDDGKEVWRNPFASLNDGFGYHAVDASDRASFAAGGVIVLEAESVDGVEHVGLDARSGQEQWRIADDGGVITLNTDERVLTNLAFGGELAGSGPTGPLAAYDRRTGKRQWLAEDVPYFDGAEGARVAGDTMALQLFADAAPGGLMGIDLSTGKERWRRDDRIWLQAASPEAVVGLIGDSPTNLELVALDPDDGDELWRLSASAFASKEPAESTTTSVERYTVWPWVNTLVVDGVVVAQSGHVLVGLDERSGEERWHRDTTLRPVVGAEGGALLYEMGSGFELVRVDDGAALWNVSNPTDFNVQAAVSSEVTIVSVAPIDVPPTTTGGSTPAYQDPVAASAGCAGGSVLTGAFIPSIGPSQPVFDITVLLSADGSTFCVTNSAGAEDVIPFERGREVSEPEATLVQGTLADYLVVAVPSDWGQNPDVRTGQHQQLSSAMTPDGTTMLVIDMAPVGTPKDLLVDRTFTFTGSQGQTLGEVTVAAPSTGSIEDVVACLGERGVHVAPVGMPDTGPLDKQPMDPTVTDAAWTACKPLVLLSFQVYGQSIPQSEYDLMDCLATKGFIRIFGAGEIDQVALGQAISECDASLPSAQGGPSCDVYKVDAEGVLDPVPVYRNLGGFNIAGKATAPATATAGTPVTVTIEPQSGQLISNAVGFEILDHRDIVRTIKVTGGTIVPGSLVQDPPTDANAETTATATDDTVTLTWTTPIAGGGDFAYPAARFDVVASTPGTVTVVFTASDSTLRVRGSNGIETQVRALCTLQQDLTTITIS